MLHSLSARFPALRQLTHRPRKISYIPQTAAAECAITCLAMVLEYHGKGVSMADLRAEMDAGHAGVGALKIAETARRHGLQARGVKLREVEHLRFLEAGSILHWRFNHFVVFERLARRGAVVVDPAMGRQLVPTDELSAAFTGVALAFATSGEAEPSGARRQPVWRHVRHLVQSGLILRLLALSLILQLSALALPVLTGLIVDRLVPTQDLHLLLVVAWGAVVLVGFRLLASLVRATLLLHLRVRLDAGMTLEFMDHLLHLPYSFLQRRSAGDLHMRVMSNTRIREILTSSVLSAALDGTLVVAYLALLLASHWKMGFIVIGLGGARILLFLLTRRRERELLAQSLRTQTEAVGYQLQMVAGIDTIKAAGGEDRCAEKWSHLLVRDLNVAAERGRLEGVVASFLDAMAMASPLVVLLYGATVVLRGEITLGTMLALSAVAAGFLAPLTTLVQSASQFQLLGSYLARINDVWDTPRERVGGRRLDSFQGRVSVEGLSFRYSTAAPPALEDISFEVEPGQLVAVVGASGSGKSTLAGLLTGLYSPESGRVLYDRADMAHLDLQWLRSQIGFVAQRTFLFGASIRSNIAMNAPDLPPDRIAQAARLASIDDDVAAMPMGYDTVLADGGVSLSGGQQQRLALARALANAPALLILDEATSSLDAVTEAKVHGNLANLRATRIVIAHRLSTVRNADLILVLDRGRIVERGTHAELMHLGHQYRRLVDAQIEPAYLLGGAVPR